MKLKLLGIISGGFGMLDGVTMKSLCFSFIFFLLLSGAPPCQSIWHSFPSTFEVSKIAFDDDAVWIGYFGGMVQRIHDNKTTSYQIPYADRHNYISAIIIDGPKAWFGLYPYIMSNRTFLSCADNDSVVVYRNISASNIRDGLMDRDGRIWFIANENVVCRQDTSFQVYPFPYVATCIARDTDGLLWAGTGVCTLLRYDRREWTEIVSKYNYNPIHAMACDKNNTLWLATELGPIAFRSNEWEYLNEKYSIDFPLASVAIDQNDVVWFGTQNDGVLRFDGTIWTRLTIEDGMIDNHVWTVAVDDKNVKWFGTDKGISRLTENTGPVSVSRESPMAIRVSVSPNPFNSATTIRYTIPESGSMELSIYSIAGQKIRTICTGMRTVGDYSDVWDGRDNAGKEASSGIYFVNLRVNTKTCARKILMMR